MSAEHPDDELEAFLDLEAHATCPYCGEAAEVDLDPSGGAMQVYVEDCAVCCRPWQVRVWFGPDGRAQVSLDAMP